MVKKLTLLIVLFLGFIFTSRFALAASQISVSLTSPVQSAQVEGLVPVVAEATSSAGIANVTFWADGFTIGSSSAAPYSTLWNTAGLVPGSYHQLQAAAYDYAGEGTSSAIITVQITPDTTAPSVSITSPADGALVRRNSRVLISAVASDNYQLSQVEFSVNGSLLCSDFTAPFNCSWQVGSRKKVAYTLSARAIDFFGNTSTSSVIVTSY